MSEASQADRVALENTLFLALQRPALMFGCPAEGVLCNVSGSVIAGGWLGVGTWHILPWIIALVSTTHLIMRAGIARDYNFFRLQGLALSSMAAAVNTVFWGGYSHSPLEDHWPGQIPMRIRVLAWFPLTRPWFLPKQRLLTVDFAPMGMLDA